MSPRPAIEPPPYGTWVPGNRWDLVADSEPTPRSVRVVVAHYDQPRALARTLHALARQTYPAHLVEVVVADDGSAVPPVVPDGVALVRQEDRGFRLAQVRNLGAADARTDLLCFLDADTTPEPGFLSELLGLPSLLPEAVVVGRRRHADLSDHPVDLPVETIAPAAALPEPAWLSEAYRECGDLLTADDRSYRFLIGAAFACSRWLFETTGGFDPTFTAYGGEDWDWFHRAWLEGAVFAHRPDAVAWHDGPDVAGRHDSQARRTKNAESLRLARDLAVPGSAGHGVLAAVPDVVVTVAPAGPAALFVCIDSVLASLPLARIAVPPTRQPAGSWGWDPRVLGGEEARAAQTRARTVLKILRPVALLPDSVPLLRDLLGPVAADAPVTTLTSAQGEPLARVVPRRAAVRARRWGSDASRRVSMTWPGVVPLGPEPDVEAWVGGWAGRSHLEG